jgi:hypothetical protein
VLWAVFQTHARQAVPVGPFSQVEPHKVVVAFEVGVEYAEITPPFTVILHFTMNLKELESSGIHFDPMTLVSQLNLTCFQTYLVTPNHLEFLAK